VASSVCIDVGASGFGFQTFFSNVLFIHFDSRYCSSSGTAGGGGGSSSSSSSSSSCRFI